MWGLKQSKAGAQQLQHMLFFQQGPDQKLEASKAQVLMLAHMGSEHRVEQAPCTDAQVCSLFCESDAVPRHHLTQQKLASSPTSSVHMRYKCDRQSMPFDKTNLD